MKEEETPRAANVLRKKRRQLERLLSLIQSLSAGRLFKSDNQLLGSKELTKKLFRSFQGEASHTFSIGPYRVSIKMQIPPLNKGPVLVWQIKRGRKMIGWGSCATCYSQSKKLSPQAQDLEIIFWDVIDLLGSYSLTFNPEGDESNISLFTALVNERAVQEGKPAPKWLPGFSDLAHKLQYKGEVDALRKLLRKQYAIQRREGFPEVRTLFYARGREFIAYAKWQKRALDPNIDILEKLEKGFIRGDYFTVIPVRMGSTLVGRKVFLFVYEYFLSSHVEIFQEILDKAGWGGSILIATGNYPTIHQFMDSKQVDFIVQGSLGMWHDKDLYSEELYYRDDAKEWKDKILKCKISREDEDEIGYWVEQLLPKKLLKT